MDISFPNVVGEIEGEGPQFNVGATFTETDFTGVAAITIDVFFGERRRNARIIGAFSLA
jgi:hypothetical protein